MEHLLNLLWLALTLMLFLTAARSHARGGLRCSLSVALGCTALLALLMFPALSMTDDIQRARLDVETSGRHIGSTLLLGSPQDCQVEAGSLAVALLLVLIASSRRDVAGRLLRLRVIPLRVRIAEFRLDAVRPPPALA